MKPRRARLVVATALAAVVGLASPAWAVPSSTTVTATPPSAEVDTPVQLAATVDCPADPTGGLGVTFFDGSDLLDTVPVNANGQASYTATFTTTGTHTITAAYNGNADCDASNNTTTVQVTAAPPTPPTPSPGFCFLVCGGLFGFNVGDINNNINTSTNTYNFHNGWHRR
ncbi:Ig-like domain-containing protein [Streptomyces tagetis]|uniref:Ig-like domain repeat protein n=1 Tax=Streptomyces tagetis TaxID=2820809 RepID=A0A940XKF7_9ACTN|nr:Ig-like domain-containing protein [Streptomyces sp. RG38]MBQ0826169.1 Ig-like domain repeat protein [Streptomyces sp. RG38]